MINLLKPPLLLHPPPMSVIQLVLELRKLYSAQHLHVALEVGWYSLAYQIIGCLIVKECRYKFQEWHPRLSSLIELLGQSQFGRSCGEFTKFVIPIGWVGFSCFSSTRGSDGTLIS